MFAKMIQSHSADMRSRSVLANLDTRRSHHHRALPQISNLDQESKPTQLLSACQREQSTVRLSASDLGSLADMIALAEPDPAEM